MVKDRENLVVRDIIMCLTEYELNTVYLTVSYMDTAKLDDIGIICLVMDVIRDITGYRDIYSLYTDRLAVTQKVLTNWANS